MSWINRIRSQRLLSLSLLVFTLSAVVVLGTLLTTGVSAARGQSAAPDATPLTIPPVNKLSNEFTRIAQKIEPSVVFITTESGVRNVPTANRRPRQNDDESVSPFDRFFGSPFGDMPQQPRRRQGSGSGFVVDANGYILTNLHVVDDADSIKVKLTGEKEEYKAKLIGSDPETDIAIVKIDAGKKLQPVRIANSDGVQVGDWAVAIGAPFGLETSVTAGIVSATGRDIAQQFQRFIQTDAAINPGNSGGPLVNINGEVIGVNTMIATSSGGYQGIGFALPINMAAKVYNQVIQSGRVNRGSIGVSFPKETNPTTMKALGFDHGVIIQDVTKGGPSEKAGLKADDVLLALNGKPIKDGDDLVARVSDMPSGTKIDLTVDRGGQRLTKQVTIEDRAEVFKDDPRFARMQPKMTDPSDSASQTTARFGIGLRPLSDQERQQLDVTEAGGVVVTAVEEGSFAEEVGLREKDIIVSINRNTVSSFDDVKTVQAKLKAGDPVAFRVVRPIPGTRRGQPQTISLYVSGVLPAE